MNATFLVSYGDVLLLALATGLYFLGYSRGEKKAERVTFQRAYQDDLNNKIEEFIYAQKKTTKDD